MFNNFKSLYKFMKKLFYLFLILLSISACKAQKNDVSNMTQETAKDIYLSYLAVNQDSELAAHFSKCQFEYKENNHAGAYTCNVVADDQKTYIFVISDAKEFKSEVNPTKKDVKELVYIAHLTYDKSLNKLTGEKLLFSTKENLIIDNQEIKQHL